MKKVSSLSIFLFLLSFAYAQQYPSSYTDGKYVTVNGAKLWVVLVGHGNPLIIIPGGPGGSHIGYRAFDSLAKENEIVYFDAFGRGKSDTAKDVKEYSLTRDIEDIEGLRQALYFEKWNVLGHSYGGLVAPGLRAKISSACKPSDFGQHFSQLYHVAGQ